MGKISKYRLARYGSRLLVQVFVYAGAIAMIVPFILMFLTSLKTTPETYQWPPSFLPAAPTLEAYVTVFADFPFPRYFVNTLIVSSLTMGAQLILASMAGFALVFYRFRLKNLIFSIILGTMMMPITVTIIPCFLIVRKFGLVNSYAGIIMPNLVTAFGIFLMRQFMSTLPYDLIEAARIDGASEFRIYWQVIMPNAKGALASLSIFAFMQSWNDFLWPLIVISDISKRTLTLGLALMQTPLMTEWNKFMAGTVYALGPVLVLYIFLQRFFIKSIALSGLKT